MAYGLADCDEPSDDRYALTAATDDASGPSEASAVLADSLCSIPDRMGTATGARITVEA